MERTTPAAPAATTAGRAWYAVGVLLLPDGHDAPVGADRRLLVAGAAHGRDVLGRHPDGVRSGGRGCGEGEEQ